MTRHAARWGVPFLALLLVVGYASGRRGAAPVFESRLVMDTLVTVTLWGAEGERAARAFGAAFGALEAVDREMARIPGTPLWRLNQEGGGPASPALREVLAASVAWARRTRGAFDPTLAPLLDLWDVPAGPKPPPSDEALVAARARIGWERLRLVPGEERVDLGGAAVDLGGIAKGWALDRAADALRAEGVASFIVDAGGDLYVAGSKGGAPWRVGIQDPRVPDAFLRVVAPAEGSLVTSGDYERFYEWEGARVHHLLDPRTGRPAGECRSVTVWATSAVDADALATAVFVLGPQAGLALLEAEPGAEGLVVDDAGRVYETPGFAQVAPAVAGR